MNQENWFKAHINAYHFFGRITKLLVPDNLKTGVAKYEHGEVNDLKRTLPSISKALWNCDTPSSC